MKIILGLTGETGSGKDTIANYLNEKYQAKVVKFIDPIREALRMFFEEDSKQDQQWLALEFKKRFGKDILIRGLEKRLHEMDGLIVINGIRFWEDYEFVKKFENSHVVYVTGNPHLRWERVVGRNEKKDDNVDFEKFKEIEKGKTELQISQIGTKADFKIKNEGSLEELLKSVDEIVKKFEILK